MAPLETFSLNGRTDENQRLFSVGNLGLKNLNTTFKDVALEEHLIASTLEDSEPWVLFDSGAATHCCPKDFASEWPLLPLTGKAPPLRSISGQPLTVFGRRLVKVDFEGQPCFLHFYVCDVPYCVVSVGRLLRSGFDVNLSSKKPNTLETPDGHKVPITRHGSLLFLRPTLAPFNKEEFEVACNTFHTQSSQGTIVAPVFRPLVQYSPEGTKDRPVDLKDLADERVTYFEYADGRRETFTDNWRKAENPKGPSPERFIGKTVFKLSSKPTGRKLVGKQTTLPQPTPLRQPVPQQQLQKQEPEAAQPLFKQSTKGLKEQSTEDTFRLRLEQTGPLQERWTTFGRLCMSNFQRRTRQQTSPTRTTCGLTFRLVGRACTTRSGRHFLCLKIRTLKNSLATVA